MSFLDRLLGRQAEGKAAPGDGLEAKSTPAVLESLLRQAGYLGHETASGTAVTLDKAMSTPVVIAIVRARSNDLAMLPLKFLRKSMRGGRVYREEIEDDELDQILTKTPNDWQTAFEFWSTMMGCVTLCGNAYAWINRVDGRVVEVIPLEPGAVEVSRAAWPDYGPSYKIRLAHGGWQPIPREEMFHIRDLSLDGVVGLPWFRQAREAIGLALSQEEFAARMHKNGAKAGGLLAPGDNTNLNKQQVDELMSMWRDQATGNSNSWKTQLLPFNLKYTPLAMTGVDMQHLESRRHEILEICMAMGGIAPQRIGFADKTSSYASVEQFLLMHTKFDITPRAVMIEQAIWRDFIRPRTDPEARQVYPKFNLAAAERGSFATRIEGLAKMTGAGIISGNEARALEDLNPVDGLDEPFVPLNQGRATDAVKPVGPAAAETDDTEDDDAR